MDNKKKKGGKGKGKGAKKLKEELDRITALHITLKKEYVLICLQRSLLAHGSVLLRLEVKTNALQDAIQQQENLVFDNQVLKKELAITQRDNVSSWQYVPFISLSLAFVAGPNCVAPANH